MEFVSIITMSVLAEGVITYIKTLVVDKNIKWQMIVSMILSVAVCLLYSLDIPAAVGIESPVPYVGSVITGILVSRGSNYINDLLKSVTNKKSTSFIEVLGSDESDGVEI